MNKQILSIAFGILLLTFVSALYAGESFTLDIGEVYDYYSVVGNSSEVVLDIQQNGTILTITPNKYSVDDSYEIIFFNKEKEIIYVSTGGGGGNSRTVYRDKDVIEYVDVEVEKIVEKEVKTPGEVVKEYVSKTGMIPKVLITALILIIVFLLLWNLYKSREPEANQEEYNYRFADKEYNTYTAEKGGENKNE